MKIAHVIHSLDPRSGGPPEALYNMVRCQKAAGHDVTLVATDVQSMEPWSPPRIYMARVARRFAPVTNQLHILKGHGRDGLLRRFRYIPGLRSKLGEIFQEPPDILHVHGLFSHLTTGVCPFARREGIPYIIRPAGGLNRYSIATRSSMIKRACLAVCVDAHAKRAAAIHATSETEAHWLQQMYSSTRIEVIPHGVRVPSNEFLKKSQDMFLDKYQKLTGKRILLFLGRFSEKKQPDLLLDVFMRSQLPAKGWCLVMAGDGPMRNRLQHLAADHPEVVFTGFLKGSLKWGALAAADLFCLPSMDENFGVAIGEALAAGTPALASEGLHFSRDLVETDSGLLFTGGTDGLKERLSSINQFDLAAMGKNGRNHVMRKMGWESVVARLGCLYEDCIYHA